MTYLRYDLTAAEYQALSPAQQREWGRWLMEQWNDEPSLPPRTEVERFEDWTAQ